MTLEQDILSVLTKARNEIQANMQSKGINASGRTSRGFVVEKYDGGLRLILRHDETATIQCAPRPPKGLTSITVGTAPLNTLEVGIDGIKRPPRGFYYMIKQWTRDKGLQFASESERQTFSYFTARKIIKQGTARHRNPVDVWSIPVKKAQATLQNDIRAAIGAQIHKAVTNF